MGYGGSGGGSFGGGNVEMLKGDKGGQGPMVILLIHGQIDVDFDLR